VEVVSGSPVGVGARRPSPGIVKVVVISGTPAAAINFLAPPLSVQGSLLSRI